MKTNEQYSIKYVAVLTIIWIIVLTVTIIKKESTIEKWKSEATNLAKELQEIKDRPLIVSENVEKCQEVGGKYWLLVTKQGEVREHCRVDKEISL